MAELAPEEDRVMHLPSGLFPAVLFYRAVRELDRQTPVFAARVMDPSLSDQFLVQVAREVYFNGFQCGGTHGTHPDDVIKILRSWFEKPEDNDD